jgi:hypothetical protein
MTPLAIWMLSLAAAVWLTLGLLTALGARNRGQRWRFGWLSGLFFPLTWVIWYVVDDRAAGGRSTRLLRRSACKPMPSSAAQDAR